VNARTRRALSGALALFAFLVFLAMAEYGLRAWKSLTYDGVLHLASASINNRPHPRYGWAGPASVRIQKDDACYGRGVVSYDADGFRSGTHPKDPDLLVCIIGDSAMQAYQIPDGLTLPDLVAARLRQHFRAPDVLRLAVGGYGTLQEWMLFEDYCRARKPAALILDWSGNDVINNSFLAERHGGSHNNNARPRPYLEDGAVRMRRPYPLHLTDGLDELLTVRLLNTALLDRERRPAEELARYEETGWQVADDLLGRMARSVEHRIALVRANDTRAMGMFERHGFRVVAYPDLPPEDKCLPRDFHPNPRGHRRLFDALWPVLSRELGLVPGR
jgi:hypothetical protein